MKIGDHFVWVACRESITVHCGVTPTDILVEAGERRPSDFRIRGNSSQGSAPDSWDQLSSSLHAILHRRCVRRAHELCRTDISATHAIKGERDATQWHWSTRMVKRRKRTILYSHPLVDVSYHFAIVFRLCQGLIEISEESCSHYGIQFNLDRSVSRTLRMYPAKRWHESLLLWISFKM